MTWAAHDALSECRRALDLGGHTNPRTAGNMRALWAADHLGWLEIRPSSDPDNLEAAVTRHLTEAGRLAALSDAQSAAEYLDHLEGKETR